MIEMTPMPCICESGMLRREAAAEQVELGKAAKADADLRQNDDATAHACAEIEERQQRNRDQPGQERRGRAAVEVATPENGEQQHLHRKVAQETIAPGEFQQERKHPEQGDRQREDSSVAPGCGSSQKR